MKSENPPEYRLRLFLSVDLVGSTAFKSQEGNTNIKWIKAFQKFYGEFPKLYFRNFAEFCNKIPEITPEELANTPKIWKTIGDEILFVVRVNSVTHLGACVSAFVESLKEFGREVQNAFSLNTKGNAWLAAFPTPNRSILLSSNGDDPLIGPNDVLTEEFEAAVDSNPGKYDFLGKGIDGGFRISRNSTVDTLTISPALAYLLCRAKRNIDTTSFDCRFVFHEPQEFKGMVKGEKYPVISIITSRDDEADKLQELEARLLGRPREANFVTLSDYLEKYMVHHGIEKPELKLTHKGASVSPPPNYQKYIEEWRADLDDIKKVKALEESAGQVGNDPDARETSAILNDTNELSKLVKLFIDLGRENKEPADTEEQ